MEPYVLLVSSLVQLVHTKVGAQEHLVDGYSDCYNGILILSLLPHFRSKYNHKTVNSRESDKYASLRISQLPVILLSIIAFCTSSDYSLTQGN